MPLPERFIVTRRVALGAAGAGLATIMQGDVQKASAAPALLTAWADGWSTLGEPERLLALFDDEMAYEDVAFGDVVRGTDGFRTLLGGVKQAIPDFRIQMFDGFSAENMAAVEYEITGTQTGDLPYLKATGKPFRLRASSILSLKGGKISRESRYYDMCRFLVQLGALAPAELPPLGTPAARPGGAS